MGMSDGNDVKDNPGQPLTPKEREDLREMLDSYKHSRWLVVFSMKLAKWIAAITAGIIAYKQLPGLLKW